MLRPVSNPFHLVDILLYGRLSKRVSSCWTSVDITGHHSTKQGELGTATVVYSKKLGVVYNQQQSVMSDESRIRELSELIRNKCLQARQQQPPAGGQAPNTAMQAQGAEVLSRLREVIVRLQEEIKDPSLAGIQQRLQYTASKLGLSYSNQRSANGGVSCYLNTESFYVEVCLSDNGTVTAANVVLGQETQKNTDILVKLLQECKYIEFEKHIKSLVDLFSQATGQDTAVLLLKVVFAVESILSSIENPNYSNPIDSILLTHLGIVTPRKAGLPMKLTFFITPSEGISAGLHQGSSSPIIEGELDVGISAKVQVERSSTQFYRLPIDPNIFNPSQGAFAQLTEQNSVSVPLTLILSLNEDVPICTGIAEKLQQTVYPTTQTLPSLIAPHVDQLIISEASKKVNSNLSKEHITNSVHTIYLPGQVHEYVGLGVHYEVPNSQRGVLLPNRSVPFTHPVHVIKIIYLLRQQLVYNALLVSCLTRKSFGTVTPPKSLDDYSFHVTTQPPEGIVMTTQLLTTKGGVTPLKLKFLIPQEKVAPTEPVLHLQVGSDDQPVEQSPSLNTVLAKSLSIPVTIHAAFSRSGVLPPSVAAAFKDHQDALKAFNSELTSCGIPSGDFGSHMTSLSEQQLTGAAGSKRKRPPV